jgi:hypothetical protein
MPLKFIFLVANPNFRGTWLEAPWKRHVHKNIYKPAKVGFIGFPASFKKGVLKFNVENVEMLTLDESSGEDSYGTMNMHSW